MSLKRINEKLASKEAKIQWSMEKLLKDRNSPIFCDHCDDRLGILRMIKSALFKKQGMKYLITCKNCKKINIRVKGQLSKDIDKDWCEYGF